MALRFAILGSGSRGNAMIVEAGATRLLIDCGFTMKEAERRLEALGVGAEGLSAVLVTHEHTDHIYSVGSLARKYRLPVWMTPGTLNNAHSLGRLPEFNPITSHASFTVGDILVEPYPVPHDAREPCQYIFNNSTARLGLLTDSGWITPHISHRLTACNALILECNHDSDMLASGPYPQVLKQRVAGSLGHLSNEQAVGLLAEMDTSRLRLVVAAHLSEQNNTPERVRSLLERTLGDKTQIEIAPQNEILGWQELK